jgi:dienelactone hydrolase
MKPAALPVDQLYQEFIRDQVRAIHRAKPVEPPATETGWIKRLAAVKEGLKHSIGRLPEAKCDLAPEILGSLQRDGFVIERLTFQSRPGVRVTANLYRPTTVKGKSPAVLCVHGHWPWARIDPNVQARCLGLVKLGYVVLAVDAFGAGERAIDPKPGTYHGAIDGASLWPTGVSLLGLQVYDNHRAVDYLLTRPEVDGTKLAITGASGGGNQSLYAGAVDDRFAAVVPVCGVGRLENYVESACCVCEMNAAGLTYATTGDLLALMAPRAVLVINATKDSLQFSVGEAARSITFARNRFVGLGIENRIRQLPVEGGHAYSQPMREALYGWLAKWLRGQGDGTPIAEPKIVLEDPQVLRCYPDTASRPKTVVTIPEFALAEGRARLAKLPPGPLHKEHWDAQRIYLSSMIEKLVAGPVPGSRSSDLNLTNEGDLWSLSPEPGLRLTGRRFAHPDDKVRSHTLLIRPEGEAKADDPIVKALLATGRNVISVDLRATGRGKPATGIVRTVADHNEAEWGLWVGRPLFGQWIRDIQAWIDARVHMNFRAPQALEVVGVGAFGIVAALAAASRTSQIHRIGLLNPLVSFVGPDSSPWSGVPMGMIVPGLLETADVGQLLALASPLPLTIAGGIEPTGGAASPERRQAAFGFTRQVYKTLQIPSFLKEVSAGVKELLDGLS